MTRYDAIVIGTGIGGAGIGALLAHAGWKILIMEKNNFVGGRCTTYEREGFTVDLGQHNYSLSGEGPLGDIYHQVGMSNAIEWISMHGKSNLQFGDTVTRLTRKTMIELVPENERGNLKKLFERTITITDEELDKLYYVPLSEWVDTFTKDPIVHMVIDNLVSQAFCVPSNVASTAEWIKVYKGVFKKRLTGYPKGGNIVIPKTYISAIEKYGGEVRLNAAVHKIIVEDGVAAGVRLKDGTEFSAPVIISNADIKATVLDLVGEEYFPNDYIQRIKNLTYSCHAVTLKVATNVEITDVPMVIYIPDEHHPTYKVSDDMKDGNIPEWVGAVSFVTCLLDPSLAPPGKQLISFISACPPDQDWKKWERMLFNNFYRVYPQARGNISSHWLETPAMVNALGGEGGNIIGVAQTVDQVHERRPSVISPLKGLYFSSAEAGGHGVGTELAANSAKEVFAVLTAK